GGADPREQPVDGPELGAASGHKASHLRENGYERVLAQIGRFSRHVRAGEEIDAAFASACRRGKIAVIGKKRTPVAGQHLLHDGMASAFDNKIEREIDFGPYELAPNGNFSERRGDVEERERFGRPLEGGCRRGDVGGKRL